MSDGEIMIRGNYLGSTTPWNVSGGKLYIDFQYRKPNDDGIITGTGEVIIPANPQTLSSE